jgi:Tfp pilus assembly PilM family ATPase
LARFLALDWSQRRIRLVAASAGRGKVRIEQALVWGEDDVLSPATAEVLGQRLREGLKQARLSPAPLLACLGREQVILKEIRYPKTDAAQEPALVRFQASKELTEAPDSVVIDYTPLDRPGPGGEQRALVLAARRDLVSAFRTMCKAAGLKPLALTVRPFGLAACLRHSAGPAGAEAQAVAATVVADGWAEFCVARGAVLLYARPLPPANGGLPAEVRRNLALYAGQAQAAPVQALYAGGDGEQVGLRVRLQEALTIPVHPLDPFAQTEGAAPAADRAGFAGAVGLLHLWAERQATPVNFLAPKEPRVEVNTGKRKTLRAVGLGVVGLVAAFFLANLVLAGKRSQLAELRGLQEEMDAQLRELQPDKKNLDALKEWHKTALPVIDELYDLTARFPYKNGLLVTKLEIAPVAVKGAKDAAAKSIYTMHMTVTGVVSRDDSILLEGLVDAINQDPYCRAGPPTKKIVAGAGGPDGEKAHQEFVMQVDIAPRPQEKYVARLVPPAPFFTPGKGFGGPPGKGFGGFAGGGRPGGGGFAGRGGPRMGPGGAGGDRPAFPNFPKKDGP